MFSYISDIKHTYAPLQVCVSVPTWNAISFLNVGAAGNQVRYGVFGFTGSKIGIGYEFQGGGYVPSISLKKIKTQLTPI